jgi:myo-inositol 2-dehydrogenase/D-chiro-inositol 1-dehydrogenase
MPRQFGVGFIGGGPVTQAIHLPVLATMPDRFKTVRVMDVNPVVAKAVAARSDAKASTEAMDVYDDPAVEIAVICSPNAFHAEQVIACCKAGKRLVLCEKPLAVSRKEAADIGRVARETGTPLIVGTMHAYDPAYRAAHAAWVTAGETASLVRSSIYLPTNDVFVNQATDQVALPPGTRSEAGDLADPKVQAAMLRGATLGLAIHNIPLVRELYPVAGALQSARFLRPFGYAMSMTNGDQAAEFLALMPGEWPPQWRLRAVGRTHELRVSFPPSYVLAGSSRAELVARGETRIFEDRRNGYEAMWAHVGDVAERAAEPLFGLDAPIADLTFALDLADSAENYLLAKP